MIKRTSSQARIDTIWDCLKQEKKMKKELK